MERKKWLEWLRSADPDRLVFLDETGAKTNMTRRYGRGKSGERVRDVAPQGHWNTTTLVAGVNRRGAVAPMVLDGPMDRVSFECYVEQLLIPEIAPGSVVVVDNLSAHKSPRIAALLHEANCELRYLPPYSPDFNPIEQMWSKVKNHLNGAKARTQQGLRHAIAKALSQVTASDAEGFFLHCGVGIII